MSTPTANVPTALQKSGDFSQTFTSANALIRIYDPQTTVADPAQKSGYSRSPFPGNVVPQNRMDPIMKKIIGFYPDPTLAISPTLQTNWSQNFALITHRISGSPGRIRTSARRTGCSSAMAIRLRRASAPSPTSLSPGREPTAAETSQSIAYTYALSDTETFSSNLVGEFRLGYTRSVIKLTPLSVGFDITSIGLPAYLKTASADAIFPRINITDFTAIGPDRASHDVDAENTPEVQAHFTWLKGSHAIKTGYDMLFCQFNTFRPDYPSGTFSFGRKVLNWQKSRSKPVLIEWAPLSQVKCACTSGVFSASTSCEARCGPTAVKSVIVMYGKMASADAAFRYAGRPSW